MEPLFLGEILFIGQKRKGLAGPDNVENRPSKRDAGAFGCLTAFEMLLCLGGLRDSPGSLAFLDICISSK